MTIPTGLEDAGNWGENNVVIRLGEKKKGLRGGKRLQKNHKWGGVGGGGATEGKKRKKGNVGKYRGEKDYRVNKGKDKLGRQVAVWEGQKKRGKKKNRTGWCVG